MYINFIFHEVHPTLDYLNPSKFKLLINSNIVWIELSFEADASIKNIRMIWRAALINHGIKIGHEVGKKKLQNE